jgi:hypothetical protein
MSGFLLIPTILIPSMGTVVATAALGLLGFNVLSEATSLLCGRKRIVADIVLESESGLQIGVRKNRDGTLELLVDEDELRVKEGIELKEFEEQIQQKYAYVKLLDQLKAEGYQVVEESEEEGETIRLVVRRWR